jgi:hypothetical protein
MGNAQLPLEQTDPDRPNWRQADETEAQFVRRMLARARSQLPNRRVGR